MSVDPALDSPTRSALLALARASVEAAARGAPAPAPAASLDGLRGARACFVTLHSRGRLRGCIGQLEGVDPLPQAVVSMASAAATRDPRFAPVRPDEVGGLHIEISALTPPVRVDPSRFHALEIGRHGLIVSRGERRGVLLPQVASERRWTVPEFLAHTCVKAGLAPDAYLHPDARVECFEAEVFGEAEATLPRDA